MGDSGSAGTRALTQEDIDAWRRKKAADSKPLESWQRNGGRIDDVVEVRLKDLGISEKGGDYLIGEAEQWVWRRGIVTSLNAGQLRIRLIDGEQWLCPDVLAFLSQ